MTEVEARELEEQPPIVPAFIHNIEDVPFFPQMYPNWRGYASLAMLLRFRGFPITQEELFHRVHPDLTDINTLTSGDINNLSGATFSHLAMIAQKIVGSNYTVGLFHHGKYKDKETSTYREAGNYHHYEKRIPGFTPAFLLDSFLERGNPCMIRLFTHNVLVTGVGEETDKGKIYTIHNPLRNESILERQKKLYQLWESDDEK